MERELVFRTVLVLILAVALSFFVVMMSQLTLAAESLGSAAPEWQMAPAFSEGTVSAECFR